jgi:hypothetical protein
LRRGRLVIAATALSSAATLIAAALISVTAAAPLASTAAVLVSAVVLLLAFAVVEADRLLTDFYASLDRACVDGGTGDKDSGRDQSCRSKDKDTRETEIGGTRRLKHFWTLHFGHSTPFSFPSSASQSLWIYSASGLDWREVAHGLEGTVF